jgi:hypothetical protein
MTFESIAREILQQTGANDGDIDRAIRVGMTEYPGVLSMEVPAGEEDKYRKLATIIFCNVAALDRADLQEVDAYFASRSHAVGSAVPRARFTEAEVLRIRAMHKPYTMSAPKIARLLNLPKTTVAKIIYRQTWRHI